MAVIDTESGRAGPAGPARPLLHFGADAPGWLRLGRRARDSELELGPVGRDVDLDLVPLRKLTQEDLLRERVLDVALDRPLQRPGPEVLVEPVLGEELRGCLREPESQLFLA